MNILLFLPDSALGAACELDKSIAHICNSHEFWRQKISILLDHNFKPFDKYDYKEIYQRLREGGLGKTPDALLALAAKYGYLDIVKILVENGANLVSNEDEIACIATNSNELYLLHDLSDEKREYTSVALIVAVIYGHLEVVDYLMKEMESPPFAIDYSLELAAKYGKLGIVVYLMNSGASFTAMERALYQAAEHNQLEVIKYMVEHTPLALPAILSEALFNASKRGNLDIVKYLIGIIGPVLNAMDVGNAIDIAILENYPEIIKYLIDLDVNEDLISSAFTGAALYGNLPILKYLIEKGADIHIDHDIALRRAAEHGHLHILKYLIDTVGMVANYNILVRASAISPNSNLGVVHYLISKGADKKSIPSELRDRYGI
jgi:ankyrin repeat protein